MVIRRKIFQIGTDYAKIPLTNSTKGGDQEEKDLRYFRFSKWSEVDHFSKTKIYSLQRKKGGFSHVKKERTKRFYID